jgi:drug/metabolite transporter (DMT)-like permease
MATRSKDTANHAMSPTEWGLLLLLSLIWGGSFFFNAIAVTALPPFTIVACRVAIGALCLIAVLYASGGRLATGGKTWGAFFLMGLMNNAIPFSLIVWGQRDIASGLAAILNATTPLFTVVIAHYTTGDDKMTVLRIGGILAGLIGVAILIGGDALSGVSGHLAAEIAVLVASVSYAISSIYGRRFSRAGLAPLATAAGQISASAMIMVPVALIIDQPWQLSLPLPLPVVGALLGIGALSTCLAYILFYRILATAGPVNLMLVTLLIPVSAILLGALFLHERLEANDFLGMAAIALGLLAIDGRVFRIFGKRAAD